jgi:hypothetical protein
MSPRQRSAVSNGRIVLSGLNGASAEGRRLRDLIADLSRDMGEVSEADRQQIRLAAAAIVHSETVTAAVLSGEPIPAEDVTRASNNAARLLNALQRRRKPKPTGPSLDEYVARVAQQI